ncbi:hypothetical protein SK128_017125 [Halocaridina rubra]|uniref:C-type lectin domain-containing protein n=1 Tax=Halocaridina rubra TaxID=373956 RepID=A0AAN8ZVI0_HALRR
MKGHFSILASILLVTLANAISCPADFFEAGNGCFAVYDQPSAGATDLQWPEARTLCQGLAEPGWDVDLATFDNTEQLEAVSAAWAAISDGIYPYMWIGITRHSGEWQYIDGRTIPMTSNIWQEGHPHDMNMHVYLNDVTLATGQNSWGRLYAACTSADMLRRYMCRAFQH